MPEEPTFDPQRPAGNTEANQARGMALRLLTTRPRSVSEMRDRLAQKFGADATERTVARLVTEGLLNDEDFALQWRQSRERRKPRSPGMIRRELKEKGISDELIENALDGLDPLEAAYRSVSRYAARQAKADRPTFDRRVGAFLGRRGFDPGVTTQTLRRLREELLIGNPGAAEGQPE